MLTFDDLDHFDERTMAGLFDPAVTAQERASAQARRERILACLRHCRDVPSEHLPADGLATARRQLRRALRNHRRSRRSDGDDVLTPYLESALHALGEKPCQPGEDVEVAALRLAVEREIQAAACSRDLAGTVLPTLLTVLARGDFELGAGSDLSALADASRRFNGSADIELELRLDLDDVAAPVCARVRAAVACGLWRWSTPAGGYAALGDQPATPLTAEDDLLAALLAGVALQNGRPITVWAANLQAEGVKEAVPAG